MEALAPYDLDWWLPHVRQICDQFVRASQGDIDRTHWRDIYKQERAYGVGHRQRLAGEARPLPEELADRATSPSATRCWTTPTSRCPRTRLPSGVSQVPFRCRWPGQAEDAAMEFLGGFVGVTQDAATLALRPKLGWAVRQGSELDRLFARLSKHKPAPPLDAPEFDRRIAGFKFELGCELPGDFLSFYKHCNGVGLFGDAFRFRPLEAVEAGRGDHDPAAGRLPRLPVQLGTAAPGSASATWRTAASSPSSCGNTYEKGWKVVRVGAGSSGRSAPSSPGRSRSSWSGPLPAAGYGSPGVDSGAERDRTLP